jgi:23S rRNA (adenine-N6)-dimethyltransferase
VAVRRLRNARPPGRHYLRSRDFAAAVVADAGVSAGELALDLGAGEGIITRALLDAGAEVWAVELDETAINTLRTRFGPRVRVARADARTVALPPEPFRVVANLPFAATSAIVRRLLADPRLTQLDAIVEWGFAVRKCAVWPSTLTAVEWSSQFRLELVRRVPRASFAPPPRIDAAVLRALRRETPLVDDIDAYRAFLRRSFGDFAVERAVGRSVIRRVAHELGFDPRARGRDLDARQWAALFTAARSTRRPRGTAPRTGPRR